ncbi:hypothetical protein C8Q75DRAFT_791847 [Abortiporus biennis]|nr:hypothetical protein C8Q75DRAFT_791847 [Abortiporus biennis]
MQPQYLPVPPGSYFPPPISLPANAATGTPVVHAGQDGFSADWTGFPSGPPPAAAPAGTPWNGYVPVPSAPGTAYSAFQQPLPGFPVQQPPPWAAPTPAMAPIGMTPYIPAAAFPAPSGIPQWGGMWQTPGPVPGAGLPPGFAQAPAAPAHNQRRAASRPREIIEQALDKWDEDAIFPVLETFLLKKLGVRLELNPLLKPPPDDLKETFLKWDMLFPTGQCQRSCDPVLRSWSVGRNAPATWPRVKSLRLLPSLLPWDILVTAGTNNPDIKFVTCGDVIEAIHDYMYGRVSASQMKAAVPSQVRVLQESFHHNRSTAPDVPGGRLVGTLLRCDWLGNKTLFGGLVNDDELVKRYCAGKVLPGFFKLECVQRYPMTEDEQREQEARIRLAADEDARRARRRSRANSRTASRPPSRPRSSVATDETSSDD